MERQYITKNRNNNSSTNAQKSPLARTAITQTGTNTNALLTQQDIENQQYQQDRFEATKLEIQAKHGTITPLGQERLNLLQAKKAEFWQRYLGNNMHRGHDFSQIPVRRQDASPIKAIQPKLTIGAPGDKYEQEADRVAAQVVNQINAPVSQQPTQSLQREEMSEEEDELMMKPEISNIQREAIPEEEEDLQMKQAGDSGMAAPAELESSIQQARGGGQPLADNVRKPMEHAFGFDFSGVKVHADSKADQLNRSIQARAFTTGQDVFFRQGEYNHGSRGGQELIAHELTHVIQQNGSAAKIDKEHLPGVIQRVDDPLTAEDKADDDRERQDAFSSAYTKIQQAVRNHRAQSEFQLVLKKQVGREASYLTPISNLFGWSADLATRFNDNTLNEKNRTGVLMDVALILKNQSAIKDQCKFLFKSIFDDELKQTRAVNTQGVTVVNDESALVKELREYGWEIKSGASATTGQLLAVVHTIGTQLTNTEEIALVQTLVKYWKEKGIYTDYIHTAAEVWLVFANFKKAINK